MVMISGGILKIKQYILDSLEGHYSQCNIGNHITKTQLIDYMNANVMSFFEKVLPQINELIQETIASLAIREASNRYIEYMMDQKSMLETLVLVQIDVIEEQLSSDIEREAVRLLIELLQELYQRTLGSHDKIKAIQSDHIAIDQVIDLDTIKSVVENNLLTRTNNVLKLLDSVEDNRQASLDELHEKVTDELDKITSQTVNDIKNISAPYQILSCSLLELFGNAVEALTVEELHMKQRMADA